MSQPHDEAMSCEEAQAAMASFFASGFKVGSDAKRQEAMRRHMADCEACDAVYLEMGGTTASLRGVADRRRLIEAQRRGSHRHSRPRARGLGAMSVFFAWNQKPPSNRVMRTIWRLRPVLIVAFFIFLISQLTKPAEPGPRFEVQWTAGRIHIDGKELMDDLPNFGLARGGEVITEEGAGAVVFRGATRVEMAGGTHLLVEKVNTARLRLFAGSAVAEGPFQLGAGSAMLVSHEENPARLELSFTGGPVRPDLVLRLLAGELDLTTPRLEEHLSGPATLKLDSFGEALAPLEPGEAGQ